MVWDLDAHYLKGHCLSHNTSLKVQIQETTAKKPRTNESRPKDKSRLTASPPLCPALMSLPVLIAKIKGENDLKRKRTPP